VTIHEFSGRSFNVPADGRLTFDTGMRRTLDIAGAGLAAILLAPVALVVMLAVWIEGGRPILFSQLRLGQNGRPFRMYKFRKFRVDCDDRGCPLTMEGDGRLTGVGRVLEIGRAHV